MAPTGEFSVHTHWAEEVGSTVKKEAKGTARKVSTCCGE